MAHNSFHTYHIFRWLTGDELLLTRYLEICHDKILDDATKRNLLEKFVLELREMLSSAVDWEALLNHGKKIPKPEVKNGHNE